MNPDRYDALGISLATGVLLAAAYLVFGGQISDAAHSVTLFARL